MRFRTKKIGFFAQILKRHSSKRDYKLNIDITRSLWTSPAYFKILRFARFPFRTISCPSWLGATIVHHFEQKRTQAALQVKDNPITGTRVRQSQVNISESMKLQDWKSNSKEFNKGLSNKYKLQEEETRELGLMWKTDSDELCAQARCFNEMKIDPLGHSFFLVPNPPRQTLSPGKSLAPGNIASKSHQQQP